VNLLRTHLRAAGRLAVAVLWIAGGFALGGQDESPLPIGTRVRIRSELLHEERTLSIRLPRDYARSRVSYPVIYLLYGDQTEGYFAETVFAVERLEGGAEIPDFIIVGLHNVDRYGDLLPVHFSGRPGGADVFLDFLEKELFPFVESKYRTQPFRLLIGPQAGGPFGLYALTVRPGLFGAMVLENPFSAPASREVLQTKLREYAAARPEAKAAVVFNTFDRTGFQDHGEANAAMAEALDAFERSRPAGIRVLRQKIEEPTFVPALELKSALRFIFEGFSPPAGTALNSLADIRAFYREIGRRLGFEPDPPAFLLAIKADDLNQAGRPQAAREVLEFALALRPEESNAAFRLGNMALQDWDLDRAESFFRPLQERAPDPFFASRLETIRRMRDGSAAYALSLAMTDGLPRAKAMLAEMERRKDESVYFDENELNTLGYRLLGRGAIDQAVFVFELNARRHAASWNAHDSLGEAYEKSGRTSDAIRSYERSLGLNPKNDNARKRLEALRRRLDPGRPG
jgi:tetratricopeptide (TPR) repeat protein